jgi:molybdate/tungstate transport system substrate-binding protein
MNKGSRLFVALFLLSIWLTGCNRENRTPLRIFIAGSLVVPFESLESSYEELHPEIDVQVEAHGSIQVIRHVTEIHDAIDVVVPADYGLIPMLMYNQKVPETGNPYASWYIKFASNQLILAYTPESQFASEINAENWFGIISRPEVRFGLSDPRFDAAGYRALMAIQLAEKLYSKPAIFERIFLGKFKNPITVQKADNKNQIHVPEILETSVSSNILLRGSSVALLALLESGDVDYAFEYASVARQHGLSYVALPPQLNLSDPAFSQDYRSVEVLMDFQRFSSVTPKFPGEVITYGVTIPSNAPHPDAAADFVVFMLGKEGQAIMEAHAHPPLDLMVTDGFASMPTRLSAALSLSEE